MTNIMTLEEAIMHCKEKACDNTQCAREHRQLAEWLNELKELRFQKKEIYKKLFRISMSSNPMDYINIVGELVDELERSEI